MGEVINNFIQSMGIVNMDWRQIVMILIACVLLYLAIAKGFEPLLLVPIAFGMLLTNLPLAGAMNTPISSINDVSLTQESINGSIATKTWGLLYYLYQGCKLGIFPPLIFLGVGAMTDFGPMISNPKSILLGAAAQFGIFFTFIGALALGFTGLEASSIGIIGGADGPTAIYLTTKLAPHLLASIAVAAYSYMALVPIIQPPIMKALTTKEERNIIMKQSKPVSKKVKIIFL
ncbi:sodium ion-translocating decarboxylase subunit beta [Paraclostridium bifermentans]|nr:sodium ion-translocating decarboxylase subunit beta [Paraclostridium bifermentans]